MAPQPEQQAREKIDQLLSAAGWLVCDATASNIHAGIFAASQEVISHSGRSRPSHLSFKTEAQVVANVQRAERLQQSVRAEAFPTSKTRSLMGSTV